MQMSTFLLNFHEAALLEKRLPEELYLGADNTTKETKNKYGCWWAALHLYGHMLVGHTHDDIDRFFLRLRVAIAGRHYLDEAHC